MFLPADSARAGERDLCAQMDEIVYPDTVLRTAEQPRDAA